LPTTRVNSPPRKVAETRFPGIARSHACGVPAADSLGEFTTA